MLCVAPGEMRLQHHAKGSLLAQVPEADAETFVLTQD